MKIHVSALAAVLSIVGGDIQASEVESELFGRTLNTCVSAPGAALVECARIAASVVGSSRVTVKQNMELTSGTGDPPVLEALVYDCHDTGAGLVACAVYEQLGNEFKYLGTCEESEETATSGCNF